MLTITQVQTPDHIVAMQDLMREYMAWSNTLGVDNNKAPTFEGFEEELAALPGIYVPPAGRLLLALQDGQPAGCVALKPHDSAVCELKRLYVRPSFRGANIGKQLVDTLMDAARQSGYQRIVLDSHRSMLKAHEIYRAVGFKTVDAPADFPAALKPYVVFMKCDLR